MTSLYSEAVLLSASGVESRISANNIVSTTSAPLSCWRAYFSQLLQSRELKLDGLEPLKRKKFPPMPDIGTPHSKQCGSLGISLYIPCTNGIKICMSLGGGICHSPVKYQYQILSKSFLSIEQSFIQGISFVNKSPDETIMLS